MDEINQIADEFLQWWIDPRSLPGFSGRFAPGFSFRMEPVGLADEDAVWFAEQKLPWSGVEVKERVIAGDEAVLVLEGEDPVTALRHRVSLRIVVQEGRIASVLETFEAIE
ncbi:hypothetical protein [Corallococcus terminator]|uniref:hypothetical protein n=1 Tax=Corallococcus terminator TaxID=2316733 RepID=UPI0011C3A4A8|nr:hypothetical protein [Corallococcus terminator]